MPSALRANVFFQTLEAEHRRWLSEFDPQYLGNWEKLLNSDDEAAFAEAGVRRLLQGYAISVEPNEDLTGAGPRPDFHCNADDDKFYVEVTNISIASATAKTGIPAEASREAVPSRPLNPAVFSKCVAKAAQCANVDAPALVAITTFHGFGAMYSFKKMFVSELLTGETKIACTIDKRTGNRVGNPCQTTELRSAAFLRPGDNQEVGYARSPISGLLLCALGLEPPRVLAVLHPNPARPFNPGLLPQVEFGQIAVDHASGGLDVQWPGGDHE